MGITDIKKEFDEWNSDDWYANEIICYNCKAKTDIGIISQIGILTSGEIICKCGIKINMDEPQEVEYEEIKPIK